MPKLLDRLIHTDGGLLVRILVGAAIFAVLAVVDLRRNGRAARRWREYLFLVSCVGLALVYGAANDQITVGISWEYFYYGKDLITALGSKTPPEEMALRIEAAKVGLKATWSVGLILGVVLLFANNPRKDLPHLPFARVYRLLPLMFVVPALCGAILGVVGYLGGLTWMGDDFVMIVRENVWRPYRFMAVFGIHLGGYVGGVIAAVIAVLLVRRERWKLLSIPDAVTSPSTVH